MAHSSLLKGTNRKRWVLSLIVILAFYVLIPQIGVFRHSVGILGHALPADLLIAIGFTAATYLAAAATYCLVARKKLSYIRTILIEVASMFTNRLLPAGIGGIGANYAYLRRFRHSTTQAASVVALNNLLGLAGHLLLTGIVLLLFHAQLTGLNLPRFRADGSDLLIAVAVLVVGVTWLVARRFRRRLRRSVSSVVRQVLAFRKQPLRLSAALLTSMTLTLCNILSLYYCALSLRLDVSFVAVVLIFTFGIVLGTATPTPGGLGGVEAGLVAGLVAYHVPGADALATVLAYRLISYWLALLAGAAAFVFAERKGYF